MGKTPEVTMSHRLTSAIRKDDKEIPIVKVKPGVFALREWEGKKGKRGAAAAAVAVEEVEAEDAGVNALEIEAVLQADSADDDEAEVAAAGEEETSPEGTDGGERNTPVSGEEARRANLAASGAELFDDEDDDDQPILAPLSQPGQPQQAGTDGGRRRRRRRRRGRGGAGDAVGFSGTAGGERQGDRFAGPRPEASQPRLDGQIQPQPILSVDAEANGDAREPYASRPVVRDRQQIMAGGQPTGIDIPLGEGDELIGRELADATAIVLSSFDRNAGPAPMRAIADALLRRGRLQGDPILATAQVSASIRADNLPTDLQRATAAVPFRKQCAGSPDRLGSWR